MEGPYDLADMKALLKNDIEFVIHSSRQLNFLKQIKHPKNLTVGLKISRIGSKSFDYEYGLFMENDDECAISCNMTMVCFDFSNQKSVQVFDEIKKEFQGE